MSNETNDTTNNQQPAVETEGHPVEIIEATVDHDTDVAPPPDQELDDRLFENRYEFDKTLRRMSSSLSTIADEFAALADAPETETDGHLQAQHAFSREDWAEVMMACEALESTWGAFEQRGFNGRPRWNDEHQQEDKG